MAIEFSDRTKVIIRLVLFLGAIICLGLAIYWFFFAAPPSIIAPDTTPEETAGSNSLPGANDGQGTSTTPTTPGGSGQLPPSQVADGGKTITTRLTNSAIISPQITENGEVAYYDPADGRFYTIDADGNVSSLSLTQFPSAENVTFNETADAAVIEFPDGSNIVYNFDTAKQITLPDHWEDFSFSADGSEIASKSIGSDPSNRSLVISAADGSSTTVIAALGSNDEKVFVDWSPSSSIVGFSATGEGGDSAFGQNKIYTIGEDGEASGIITVNGTNYESIWSPSGKYVLYSIADSGDDYRPSLWYVDAQGDRNGKTRLRLNIKTTVDRCTFYNESTLYCGVPSTTPAGSGGSPEILTGPDYLYKISLPTGTATLLAIPAVSTTIKNLSIDENERTLYYTDTQGKLNMIRLK